MYCQLSIVGNGHQQAAMAFRLRSMEQSGSSVLRSVIVNRRREKVTALSLGCMLSTMSHGNLKGVQTFVDARVGHRHAYHRIVYRLLIFHQNQLH